MITFQKESADLLDATLDMDEKAVADGIERIHQEYSSVIQYNDENSLSSVLTIAYLSSMQYYFQPDRTRFCRFCLSSETGIQNKLSGAAGRT